MTREEASHLVYHEAERAIDLLVKLSEALERLGFGGHNDVFYKGRFRCLPGRPSLRSQRVSFSTDAPLRAGLTAGLTGGRHRLPASTQRTPRCVTRWGWPGTTMRDRRAIERCYERAAHVSTINQCCVLGFQAKSYVTVFRK
jgi:hypothetical protein